MKEKCKQLTEIALNLCPDRKISHKDLLYLVKRYIGGNRDTVRDYLGYGGKVRGHTAIGDPRKGYLEIFGFMHKIKHNLWLIHAQATLTKVDPPRNPPTLNNE